MDIREQCRIIFFKKMHDYGTSWRVMRLPAITDQIYIKAKRIRTIEEKGFFKVNEGIESEYVGIVNYSLIALIQLRLKVDLNLSEKANIQVVGDLYESLLSETKELMLNKNHDYNEAWRDIRINSFTDLLLSKISRIKHIEDIEGKTLASEGVESIYKDMVNYSILALMRLSEK